MTVEELVYEDLLWSFAQMREQGAQVVVPDDEVDFGQSFDALRESFLNGKWNPTLDTKSQTSGFDPAQIARISSRVEEGA